MKNDYQSEAVPDRIGILFKPTHVQLLFIQIWKECDVVLVIYIKFYQYLS